MNHPQVDALIPRRVVRLVGVGGMGSVYEAWDDRLERRVALKILHPHLTADPAHRDRLLQEARLAARVEHESVVRIYAVHEYEGGAALEMQYVEGTPLHQLLGTGRYTPHQAANLMDQVLGALGACHERGIVHGDLKPGNLLVTHQGKALLADFGISRAFHPPGEDAHSLTTLSATLWGTPQYWPPEAWDGELPSPTWDLYALGLLVYEALSGALPFRTDTPAILMRDKLSRTEVGISTIRPDLSVKFAALIDAMKASDPGARPRCAAEALALLRQTPEFRLWDASTYPLTHTVLRTPIKPQPTVHPMLPHVFAVEPPKDAPKGPSHRLGLVYAVGLLLFGLAAVALFVTRSRPETVATADILPAGMVGEVLELVVANQQAFFSYDDGLRGRELWVASANGRAQIVSDINPGKGSSNPGRFLPRGADGMLFSATTPELGYEPWFCSTDNVRAVGLIKDIIPGPMSSNPWPIARWDATFMFYATTLQAGTELWLTNSRPDQTGLLADIQLGAGSSWAIAPNVAPDALGAYFVAHGDSTLGYALWRFTYADGSTRPVGKADKFPGEMIVMNETLFIVLPDKETGAELWEFRPDLDDTRLFADIWAGPGSSNPQQFFIWNDILYFQAATEAHGRELWRSDGTAEGTFEVADIDPGVNDGAPYGFVATPGQLYFRGTDITHGNELWVTDGTTQGTRLVYDIRPGVESASPYNLATIGDYFIFTANDLAHGEELWFIKTTDRDSPPRLLRDLWPGPESAEPHDLKALNENTGIFVYKTPEGDRLMRLTLDQDEIVLTPVVGLPAVPRNISD